MSTSTSLKTFASLQNDPSATSDLNSNFAALNTAATNALALNGQSPNQMQAALDMNSNRIINLPLPISTSEPLRLQDINLLAGGGTVNISPLPTGGTTGQVLEKNSNTNYDVSWQTPPAATVTSIVAGAGITVTGSPAVTVGLRDVISVKDFGATGNGVTDDTTAVQAAITKASLGSPTPCTVYFPNGTYILSSTLTISSSVFNIVIAGESRIGTILSFSINTPGIVYTSNFGVIYLRHFAISTPGAVSVTLGSNSTTPTQCTIEDVGFNSGSVELNLINCSATNIFNSFFFQYSSAGIQIACPLNVDSGDSWIHHNYFQNSAGLSGTGYCISHLSGGGWKFTNNKMLTSQYGIILNELLSGGVASDIHIEDNSIEGMAVSCIYIQNQSGVSGILLNVVIVGNEGGAGAAGAFISITATGARAWCQNVCISGNCIRNASGSNAIVVDGIISNININGNSIDEGGTPTGFAIVIAAHVTNGIVANNTITGYGTNKVSNAGTNVTLGTNGP